MESNFTNKGQSHSEWMKVKKWQRTGKHEDKNSKYETSQIGNFNFIVAFSLKTSTFASVRKNQETFRARCKVVLCKRNTRDLALGVLTTFTCSLHKQQQLLEIFTYSPHLRKDGRYSWNNQPALHRLLVSGHKASDWQWGMCREASHNPQGAAENTEAWRFRVYQKQR